LAAKIVSCLSIIRASSAGEDELGQRGTPRAHYHHQGARSHKLPAGCTVPVSCCVHNPPSLLIPPATRSFQSQQLCSAAGLGS
jgi:hypothetical protein